MALRRLTIPSLSFLFALAACGDDDRKAPDVDAGSDSGPEPDAATGDEGDAGELDCFEKPTSYVQIINACTDAERVEKDPELPQLLPDGSLPPLP